MPALPTYFWHGPNSEEPSPESEGSDVLRVADVRRVAMGLLARREHSALELQRKLAKRRFPQALIEQALIGLKDENLQCDERFAEEYVRSYARRGQGPIKISNALKQKGIDPQRANRLLFNGSLDWQALAEAARSRRFGTTIPLEFPERARQARFLQQRGFDHEQARRAARL